MNIITSNELSVALITSQEVQRESTVPLLKLLGAILHGDLIIKPIVTRVFSIVFTI